MTVPGPYGAGDPGWAQPGPSGATGYGTPGAFIPQQTGVQPTWAAPPGPAGQAWQGGYDPYQSAGYPAPGYPAQGYPAPGYPAPGYPMYALPMPLPRNGMGTAALVLGIIAVIFCWIPWIVAVPAVLAIIFGGVGVAKANQGQATNRGSAMAGLVLGIIAVAACLVLWIALFATMSAIFD